MRFKILSPLLLATGLLMGCVSTENSSLRDAVQNPARTESFMARDQYRHPEETLSFFGIQPTMTVVEIWPGADGWYTEILAPFLQDQGKYYAAHFATDSPSEFFVESRNKYLEKLSQQSDIYKKVTVTTFAPPRDIDVAPDASADMVLTFRNVHNWYWRGGGDERVIAAFKTMYSALKPGGILGVVEHRLPPSRPLSDQESSGYMREDYVIRMAEAAGFKFLEKSEINANPKDDANYPDGVWTLPPTLRLGATDKDRYLAIGESDRMTLKFVKPDDSEPDMKLQMR